MKVLINALWIVIALYMVGSTECSSATAQVAKKISSRTVNGFPTTFRNDDVELPAKVRERLKAATVFIETAYKPADVETPKERELQWHNGSGFVVASEGLIVTNAHVVKSANHIDARTRRAPTGNTTPSERLVYTLHSVKVCLYSGTKRRQVYDAQVLCTRDMPTDLALLRIQPKTPLTSLELISQKDFDRLRVTRPVWAAGFPLGKNLQHILSDEPKLPLNTNGPSIDIHPAAITAFESDTDDNVTAIRHSSLLQGGNSGGPLVDAKGRVVGVNYYGGHNLSFSIPTPVLAKEFATTLKYRRNVDEGGVREKPLIVRLELDEDDPNFHIKVTAAIEKAAKEPGATIEFGGGTFTAGYLGRFDINAKGLLIRGAGINKTKLNLTGPQLVVAKCRTL